MTAETVTSLSDRVDRLEDVVVYKDTCKAEHNSTAKRMDMFDKRLDDVQDDFHQIANRPPVWASFLIALLTGAIGGLSAMVVNLIK